MTHHLIKAAVGLALGALLVSPAKAMPIGPTPPLTPTGTFSADNDAEAFDFSISGRSIVTLSTISYSGGAFVTNPAIVIAGGGFDPILSLFDETGAFITENDDGGFTPGFDSFIQTPLDAGTYSVVITQFDNFFTGGVGDDISLGFDFDGGPSDFTSFFGCSNELFCDIFGDNRTNFFAINISAQAVPEPSTLALIGLGLVGAGLAARRRRTD